MAVQRKPAGNRQQDDVNKIFHDVFNTPKGREVLAFLRRRVVDVEQGIDTTADVLRFSLGQRNLLLNIERRVADGGMISVDELRRSYPVKVADRGE